jgi:hypothetical protein
MYSLGMFLEHAQNRKKWPPNCSSGVRIESCTCPGKQTTCHGTELSGALHLDVSPRHYRKVRYNACWGEILDATAWTAFFFFFCVLSESACSTSNIECIQTISLHINSNGV